jgi:tetratricopeptide (TPR) repeat protein
MIEIRGRRFSSLAIFLVSLVTAADAYGQAGLGWIGRKVVTKYQAPLTIGEKDVAPDPSRRVFTVERAQGNWLRLVAEDRSGSGWAMVGQVVPLEGAIAFYSDEISKGRTPSKAFIQRALLWIDRGDYDRAIEDLTGAVRRDPRSAPAYETRALVWMAKKEFGIALSDFSDVIQLRPWDFKAYIERGIAWEQSGESDRAIADFSESIRLEPRNPWAYTDRGNARRSKGDFDRAIVDYGSALKIDPDYALAFINRGLAWGAKKEYDRAVSDAGQAIRLDPGNAYAYNDRALFHEGLGDYRRAAADLEKALELAPQLQGAHAGLAMLLASCPDAKLRDGKRAVALATEATRGTEPDEPVSTAALAAACAETDDFPRAVELQEKAIRLTTAPDQQAEMRARLELYRSGKPYRLEPPAAP